MTNRNPSNTTIFLLPLFGIPLSYYQEAGFINSYIQDDSKKYGEPVVIILFDGNNGCSEIWNSLNDALADDIIDLYPYEQLVALVLKVPVAFLDDYTHVVMGDYSDLSQEYWDQVSDRPEIDKLGKGKKLSLLIAQKDPIIKTIVAAKYPDMIIPEGAVWENFDYQAESLTSTKVEQILTEL